MTNARAPEPRDAVARLQRRIAELEAEHVRDRALATLVFGSSNVPMILKDSNGIILDVNDEAVATYGWPREELLGRPIAVLLPEGREEQARELLARCRSGDSVRNVRSERRHRDGARIPVLLTLTLLTSDEGEPFGIVSMAQDLSAQARLNEEVRRHRDHLEELVAERTQALQESRARLESRNRELEGANQQLRATEQQLRAANQQLRAANQQLRATEQQLRASNRELDATNAQLRTAEGALRKHTARFQAFVDSPSLAVYQLNTAGRFVFVNTAGAEMFGRSPADVEGLPFASVVDESDRSEANALFERVLRGRPAIGEIRMRPPSGRTFTAQCSIVPIQQDGSVVGGVGLSYDVSERKRLERRLVQAQKLDSIGRLASGVAHDFNNIIMVIRSFAAFVHEELSDGDPRREDIDEVLAAADRAAALTNQLLLFSRERPAERNEVDVVAAVRNLEKLLGRAIGEDIDLVVALPADPQPVYADPVELDQILLNLAVNARDAMPRGGRLSIEVSARRGEAADPAWVQVAVTDEGVGMDEATQERVFEPFFTTKGPDGGTGLGLSTCYGIVKQLGGTIEVMSQLGEGTTFVTRLPRSQGGHRARKAETARSMEVRGNETILVVEDEPQLRRIAQRVLSRHGYRTLLAEDGPHALELFDSESDRIDLVFSDVVLPRGNGVDLAVEVRRRKPGIAILLTSGYTDRKVVGDGSELPILWKPYWPDELVRWIRLCLERREP